MAAIVDDDTVYVSFPIEKTEETPEGIIVIGKATDGSVDSDEQIVDSDWSAKAIEEWLATGPNLRVQHNPHRDPAGVGLSVEINRDGDGGHWVKSLVVEPTAKELVRAKALRAYSVGIMKPKIVSDAKARGGRIVDGELGEISLVDRPANRNCGIQLVKAAKDGGAEYSGEIFGDTQDALTKAAANPAAVAKIVNKSHQSVVAEKLSEALDHGGGGRYSDNVVERLEKALKTVQDKNPHGVTVLPAAVKPPPTYARVEDIPHGTVGVVIREDGSPHTVDKRHMDPDVGGGVDRDKIPTADFAGRDRSFPIVTPGDVSDAASSIGRAGPGNYSSDELKSRIISIARRKGASFVAALPQKWRDEMSGGKSSEPEELKGAKDCPNCGKTYHADAKVRNCESCGHDLPNASEKTTEPDVTKNPCPTCKGDGKIRGGNMDCPDCKGTGNADGGNDGDSSDGDDASKCVACSCAMTDNANFCANCGTKVMKSSASVDDSDDDDDEEDEGGQGQLSAGKASTPGDYAQDKDTSPAGTHREPDGPQGEMFEEDTEMTDGDEKREGDAEPTPTWDNPNRPRGRASVKTAEYAEARLHDVLCAAYHPDVVETIYPSLKGAGTAVDPQVWQDEAMALVSGGELEKAQHALSVATAAKTITLAHPDAVADARAALHKTFTDMYPGVGASISPTDMDPGKFKRPYLSAGHPPAAAQPPGSNPSGTGTWTQITAEDYGRGPLTSGHAAPSPGSKGSNVPGHDGSAMYAAAQVGAVMNAMKELHDHIAGRHEYLCPMTPASSVRTDTVGVGDAGVIDAATSATSTTKSVKASHVESLDMSKFATTESIEKMLGERDGLIKQQSDLIKQLQSQLDEIASRPDAHQAPVRGITATKSASGGGSVERRSLIDEAFAQERLDKISFARQLSKSGDPQLADKARHQLETLLSETTTG